MANCSLQWQYQMRRLSHPASTSGYKVPSHLLVTSGGFQETSHMQQAVLDAQHRIHCYMAFTWLTCRLRTVFTTGIFAFQPAQHVISASSSRMHHIANHSCIHYHNTSSHAHKDHNGASLKLQHSTNLYVKTLAVYCLRWRTQRPQAHGRAASNARKNAFGGLNSGVDVSIRVG